MVRSDGKTIAIGLVASALIHAGVFGVRVRAGERAANATATAVRSLAGTRLVDVVEVIEGTVPALPSDETAEARDEPNTEGAVEAPSAFAPAAATVAARTSVRTGDGRLWRPATGPVKGLSDVERLGDRIARKIAPFNDSIVPPRRAAERAVDWTMGSDSTRWGYRPGFVYVAGRKLPFTIGLAGNPESAARLREFRDARFHLESAHMRGRIDERAQMLRQRSDSLRTARRREGG